MIWAYNDEDPDDEGRLQGHLHTAEDRGSRSVQLLSATFTQPQIPDDAFDLNFTSDAVSIIASTHSR